MSGQNIRKSNRILAQNSERKTSTSSLGEIGSPKLQDFAFSGVKPLSSNFLFNAAADEITEAPAVNSIPLEINLSTGGNSSSQLNKMNAAEIQSLVEKRIPLFYGQPDVESSEVHFFLDAVKRLKKRVDETQDGHKLQRTLLEELIERLRGRAYEMIRDIDITTVEGLHSTITKNFLPTYSIEFLSNRLNTASQETGEQCADFGKRVKHYASEYEIGIKCKYGDVNAIPKPLIESMVQDVFTKGILNQSIRSHLLMANKAGIDDLIQTATRLESCFSSQTECTRINEERCQLCDETGHKAKACLKLSNSRVSESRPNQVVRNHQDVAQRAPVCHFCKRSGHFIAECRTRQKSIRGQDQFTQYRDERVQDSKPVFQRQNPQFNQLYQRQPNPAFQQRADRPHYQNQQSQNIQHQTQNRRDWNIPSIHYRNPRQYQTFSSRPVNTERRPPPEDMSKIDTQMQGLSINYVEDERRVNSEQAWNYYQNETSIDPGNESGLAEPMM